MDKFCEHDFHNQNTCILGQDNESRGLISLNKLNCPQYKTFFFPLEQNLISTLNFYSDNEWTLVFGHTLMLVGIKFLTRDGTQALCSRSTKSKPLDQQGIPTNGHLISIDVSILVSSGFSASSMGLKGVLSVSEHQDTGAWGMLVSPSTLASPEHLTSIWSIRAGPCRLQLSIPATRLFQVWVLAAPTTLCLFPESWMFHALGWHKKTYIPSLCPWFRA